MGDNDRDIGELKAELRNVRETLAEVRTDLKHVREKFSEVEGGWKVVVTMAAMAGAGLSWVTSYFLGKH